MKMMQTLQTWLLITVMALSANTQVSAKVASGGINLGSELHQSLDESKSLNALGISGFSTIDASGSPLAPNGGGLEGTVGKYKDLKKQTKNTDLTPDHQPSARALQADFENKYGRKPTADEKKLLNNNGNCVVISRCSHLDSSETYGGRNRSIDSDGRRKYDRDADDLEKAVDSNMDALENSLKNNDGWSKQQIEDARRKLHDANKDSGLY